MAFIEEKSCIYVGEDGGHFIAKDVMRQDVLF
jgi:hypothetical protein